MSATTASHAERLAAAVADAELDLLLVGDLVTPADSSRIAQANVFWASGFSGTSGFCILGAEKRLFLTDFRYQQRAADEVAGEYDRELFEGELSAKMSSWSPAAASSSAFAAARTPSSWGASPRRPS